MGKLIESEPKEILSIISFIENGRDLYYYEVYKKKGVSTDSLDSTEATDKIFSIELYMISHRLAPANMLDSGTFTRGEV